MSDINIQDVGELENFLQRLNDASKALDKILNELQSQNSHLRKVWTDQRGKSFTSDVEKALYGLTSQKRDLFDRRLPGELRRTIEWARRRG